MNAEEFERMMADSQEQAHREMGLQNRYGIWWYRAPVPRRWHRCTPWTVGYLDGERVERCACGAIRRGLPGHPWIERNTRTTP